MGQITWTEKTSEQLQAIYEYIASDSDIYARRYVRSLIHATQKLETMPECGRIVPELKAYGFREVIYRSHRIVYRIVGKPKDIEILAVIHSTRDMKQQFDTE